MALCLDSGAKLLTQPNRDGEKQDEKGEVEGPTHRRDDPPLLAFLAAIPKLEDNISGVIRREKDKYCGEPVARQQKDRKKQMSQDRQEKAQQVTQHPLLAQGLHAGLERVRFLWREAQA